MSVAYLAVGTNLGDRMGYLQGALDGLRKVADLVVMGWSSVYETAPIGGPDQGPYLNAVIAVETALDPWGVLSVAHDLEQDAERVRDIRWGPRTLDVDVLLVGEIQMTDPQLTIPHARMYERAFVLIPLCEIAPDLVADIPHDQHVVRYGEVLR